MASILEEALSGFFEIVTNPVGKVSQMVGDFAGGDVGKAIRDVGSIAGGFTSPFGAAGALRTGSRLGGEFIGGETGRGLQEWGKTGANILDVNSYLNPANWGNVPVIGKPMQTGTQYLSDILRGKTSYLPSSYEDYLRTGELGTSSYQPGWIEQGLNFAGNLYSNPLTQTGLKYLEKAETKKEMEEALNQQLAQRRQMQLASILGGETPQIAPYLGASDFNPLDVYAQYAGKLKSRPAYYSLPVNYPAI